MKLWTGPLHVGLNDAQIRKNHRTWTPHSQADCFVWKLYRGHHKKGCPESLESCLVDVAADWRAMEVMPLFETEYMLDK